MKGYQNKSSDYQKGYNDGFDYAMKKSKEILHEIIEEVNEMKSKK